MATKNNPANGGADRTLVLTRVFAAPRDLVFKAWIDPMHLEQWWGPEGFTNPVCEADGRPGGAIRIHMRGPDGTVYPMAGTFQEIDEPERIVFTAGALDDTGRALFTVRNTVTFTERNGQTTLTLEARVVSQTEGGQLHLDGMETGWTQSLERLALHLAPKSKPGGGNAPVSVADREIVISRVFTAPRELVWSAWTDPKQVVRWWGPRGFTTTIETMDVKPGGRWKHIMHGPDGTDYPNECVFTEVLKPERIVFSNGGGKRGEPGVQFESTWTFEAVGDKTKVTIRMVFPSATARDRVVREYGAIEGGHQTLERLSEHLAGLMAPTG